MRKIFTFLLCLWSGIIAAQAPSNDYCIDAEELIDLDLNCDFWQLEGATFDFMGPECSSDTFHNIWFKFTAQGTAIDIDGYLYDGRDVFIQLFKFNGPPCDSASAILLACDTNNLTMGNILQLNEEYYFSLSADTGSIANMIMCIDNPLINHDPINDYVCNATSIPFDSSCIEGTLEHATYDFPNPSCPLADERSVWYSGILPPDANGLEIVLQPLGLDTFNYEVGLYRLINGTNCVKPPHFLGGTCAQKRDSFIVRGLTPGNRYHIMVSSRIVPGHTFKLCVRPIIPPPGCALNDICSLAEEIPFDLEDPLLCVEGCNIGATTGPLDSASYCTQFQNPSVYYKFYVDSLMDEIHLRLSGTDLEVPQLAVYYGTCGDLQYVTCDYGSDGLLNFSFNPPVKNTTYYLIASDATGKTGHFNICVDAFHNDYNCNYKNTLEVISTSLGSPLDGPYKAGEVLHFRYTLEDWIPSKCNWVQGIVPVFISGWDPTSFTPDGKIKGIIENPTEHRDGEWKWYSSGYVHYNYNNPIKGFNEGDILSPGWFFLENGQTELDSSRGDGLICSDSLDLEWTIEFSIRLVPFPGCVEDTVFNALIEFKTFSDGEIGANKPPSCNRDLTTIFSVPFTCCSGPVLTGRSDSICSGEIVSYHINKADTVTEYRWSVIPNPHVEGETSVLGNELNQILINTSTTPQVVEYTVYAKDSSGCYGPPAHYDVTVFPQITVNAGPDTIKACKGQWISLGGNPTASGGVPPLKYIWSDRNLQGPNPDVVADSSRIVSLQVRGKHSCVSRDTVQIIATQSPHAILPDTTNFCMGDTVTLGIPLVGNPPFIYDLSYDGVSSGSDTTMENYISLRLAIDSNMVLSIDSLRDAICRTEVENKTLIYARDSVSEELTTSICGDEVYFVGNEGYDETGTYRVILPGASRYGCDSILILHLTVRDLIVITDTIITYDEKTDTGSIEILLEGGVPPYSYLWSTGDTSRILENVSSGDYSVTVTDSVGCDRTFDLSIDVGTSLEYVQQSEYALYPQPVLAGQMIHLKLKNLDYGIYTFDLYSINGSRIDTQQFVHKSPQHTYTRKMMKPGVYYWHIKKDGRILITGKCVVL